MSAGRASILLVGTLVVVVGISLADGGNGGDAPSPGAALSTTAPLPGRTPGATVTAPVSAPWIEPTPGWAIVLPGVVRPSGGTPLPDVAGALPADDGAPPQPLGSINDVPNPDRLDFLSQLCMPECFRDAHWIDPRDASRESGVWTAGRPFHVREGFVNTGEAPLGEGFSVVLYVTGLNGRADEPTYRYTPDYVLRGTSDRCGPTYLTQTGPTTCEWFVHDFPDGLPEGRWAIWAVWEAPCRAWLDDGLISWCDDGAAVMALFASGFDAPYGMGEPEYSDGSS